MRNAASHLKRADPVLRPLVERVGPCRIPQRRPDFSTLARAIVFQQLNGRAAQTIFDRLVAALPGGRLTPQAVLGLPQRKLRAAGLSAQKAAYLRDLAAQTAAGAIRFPRLAALPDDQVVAALTQVKGVGVWTAQMFLIFALRRPDVLAVGDYGVRAAAQKLYGLERLPTPGELEKLAEPWRPFRSAACWYLWRSKDLNLLIC